MRKAKSSGPTTGMTDAEVAREASDWINKRSDSTRRGDGHLNPTLSKQIEDRAVYWDGQARQRAAARGEQY